MLNQVNHLSSVGRSGGWRGFAAAYRDLGPPLAPGSEDCRFMEQVAQDWAGRHPGERLRALLLGVTPRLARMAWPPASFLIAADRSLEMIGSVWPGNIASVRGAIQADWLALPMPERSLDMVAGDGSPITLRYPNDHRALARAMRATLRTGGTMALRAFVRPAVREDPDEVVAELPRHATFHQFKLRLLMAMQPSPEEGVHLDTVHRFWTACHIDRAALAFETEWRREEIDTIDRYRGLDDVYTFPTLEELQSVLGEFFSETSVFVPSYPMGECCPTLVMRP